MGQADFVVTKGRIVLFKIEEDRYCPALICYVNEDKTVNLTLFQRNGDVAGVENVKRGSDIGQWTPPGVDAKEKTDKAIENAVKE